ncbi:hypothetical protein ACWENR_28210 [Micromonospora sp. NPDC004336]
MANKMLGKVVAGAALGGASLLVFTPGIAFADGHHDAEGKVYAKPHVVKAGDTVKLLEICSERQEHAYVWSKVTGKVKLKPAEDRGDRRGEEGPREHDRGKDHEGGKDHDKGRDHDKGKDHDGKDETPKPRPTDDGTGQPQPPANGGQPPANGGQPPANGGQGGGAADAADQGDRDWKGYEHGQDAEGGREDHKGYGSERGDYGREDHKGYGSDERGDYGREDDKGYGSDKWDSERGGDYGREDHKSNSSDKWDSERGGDYGREDHKGNSSDKWDSERDGKGHENGWSDEESGDYGKDKGWEHKRDFVYYGEAEVSEDAQPGRYKLKGSCGEGELVVLPRGGVDGGDGGVGAGTDRGLAAGGASLLGAAALGGLVLMRRRRTDESFV